MILVVGDCHLREKHMLVAESFCKQIMNLIKSKKYEYVVILGDVLHNHEKINAEVLNMANTFFKEIADIVPLFVLVGNHDMINNSQYLTDKHWMNCLKGFKNITIVDRVVSAHNNLFCPYVPNGRLVEALSSFSDEWMNTRIVFAHQEVRGCKTAPKMISTTGDVWLKEYPLLISGHIHQKQRLAENVIYPGSSVPTSFTDADQRYVLEFDTITFEEIYVPLDIETKLTQFVDVCDVSSEFVETFNKSHRMIVSGTDVELETVKPVLASLEKQGVKIVKRVVNPETHTSDAVSGSNLNFETHLMDIIKTSNASADIHTIYKKVKA